MRLDTRHHVVRCGQLVSCPKVIQHPRESLSLHVLLTGSSPCPKMVQTNVFVAYFRFPAHTTSIHHWSSLPSFFRERILTQTTSIYNRSSVRALSLELVGSVTRRTHSESRDEPRQPPNQPTDEVMVHPHFAADPRFISHFEHAHQANHFTIHTLDYANRLLRFHRCLPSLP